MCRKDCAMWDNEIIVLVSSLKKRILNGNARIRFGKISLDNAVPAFIKNIFKNRVEHYISIESPLSIKTTPHFDIQTGDLESLKNRFLDVFREAAVFDEKDVEGLLKEALVMRLNYLVKPMETMRRVIFDKETDVELFRMEEALVSFRQVLPYADELVMECKGHGKASIDQEDFNKLATELLHRLTEKDPVKIVLRDLSILLDFMAETKGEELNKIEGTTLQDFLADRNLLGFRRALDVEMKLGKEDFDVMDLEITLKRYIELKDEFSRNVSEKEIETETILFDEGKTETEEVAVEEKPQEVKEEKSEESLEEAEITESSEAEVLDLNEVMGTQTDEDEESKQGIEEKKQKKPMRIIRRSQKKEKEEVDVSVEELPTQEVSEAPSEKVGLKNFIDDKAEKVFVKKLFSGDHSEYEQLIGKLDEAESWRVAKILIDNELFKRDVDPFSREAIKLVDLVYSLYYPEEGVGGKK